jgi:hypothetical protein
MPGLGNNLIMQRFIEADSYYNFNQETDVIMIAISGLGRYSFPITINDNDYVYSRGDLDVSQSSVFDTEEVRETVYKKYAELIDYADRHEVKLDFSDVERVYDEKLKEFSNVIKCKMESHKFLATTDDKEIYDFIYIDGDHTAQAVFIDASLAWKALKPGGIMAFDDYLWELDAPINMRPQAAIDLFIILMKDHLTLIGTGSQIWIRKELETY